jgi:hypothetical protein
VLAAPYRKTLGLAPDLNELGLVCPDIVEAATSLEKNYKGMGPFFLSEASPVEFKENGHDVPYRTRVGFGYYQDVLLELAEPGAGDDIFATHLDPGGEITVHHMGYFARGPKLRIGSTSFADVMAAHGHPKPKWNAKVFAGVTAIITVFDTYADADGLGIEFLDYRILGIPVDYPRSAGDFLAKLQIKFGPRVLTLPGPAGSPFKAQWSFHSARTFPKTPAELWPWVTDPALMSKWMGGTVTGPAAVGGQRSIEMTLEHHHTVVTDVYRTVTPPTMWEAETGA